MRAAPRLIAAAVALVGCTSEPSFTVSWHLVDAPGMDASEGDAPAGAQACASVGLSKVRVTTLASGFNSAGQCEDTIVDERSYACYAGLPVEGPTLEPGSYTLLIQGLRRNGAPWACDTDELDLTCDETPAEESCYARATVEIEVGADGKLTSPTEPILAALAKPLPCDDGIDNDGDGRVDGVDPGCFDRVGDDDQLIPLESRREDDEEGVTVIQTAVALLGSAAIRSSNLGIESYEVGYRLQGSDEVTPLALVNEELLDYTNYPYPLPLVDDTSDPFDPELDYEIVMTALDLSGAPLTNAITGYLDITADPLVPANPPTNDYFTGQWLFEPGDFLEPVVLPFLVLPDPQLGVNTGTQGACEFNGVASLERVWLRVSDENQTPLDAATLGLIGYPGGVPFEIVEEADGWISFDCPTVNIRSQALDWGRFQIEMQARIGDQVCFETDEGALDLSPQVGTDVQVIPIARQFDGEGNVICPECSTDNDCDSGLICNPDTSLCVTKEPGSG